MHYLFNDIKKEILNFKWNHSTTIFMSFVGGLNVTVCKEILYFVSILVSINADISE